MRKEAPIKAACQSTMKIMSGSSDLFRLTVAVRACKSDNWFQSAFGSITQIPDAIVSRFDLVILPRDNLLHRRREAVIERLSVFFHGGIFTALAFSEDGMVVTSGEGGFEVNPAPVQCAAAAPAHVRFSFIRTLRFAAKLHHKTRTLP